MSRQQTGYFGQLARGGKSVFLREVIVDSNGKKLDMRFGGNLTQQKRRKRVAWCVWIAARSACQQCNIHLWCGGKTRRSEIQGNASVLPADNTLATVTFKITNKARIKDDEDTIA